jgi:lipoprotein-anchoring transpeptidase ErfK/SrfK
LVLVAAAVGVGGCGVLAGDVVPAAQVGTGAAGAVGWRAGGDVAGLTLAGDVDPDAWAPDEPIVVTSLAGELEGVAVTGADGREVPGSLAEDRKHWSSSGGLRPATSYEVAATMAGSAGTDPVTGTIPITTAPSKEQFRARISPRDGATVGVGMPILVTFTAPVAPDRRAGVQRALQVRSSPAVEGTWSWVSDTKVVYRPKEYWPAHTKVSVRADLTGVPAGQRLWGDQDKAVDFTIGRSVVSVVDVATHVMTVSIDGQVARTIPVTTGKDGFATRGGTRVISEKLEATRMDAASTGITPGDPEYYNLDVRFAMRMTNSGEFIHAAPWSAAWHGTDNVSHGCVGMSTRDARWLFEQSRVGDVVSVVNSTRALEPGNGLTQWNLPWQEWQAGSAD